MKLYQDELETLAKSPLARKLTERKRYSAEMFLEAERLLATYGFTSHDVVAERHGAYVQNFYRYKTDDMSGGIRVAEIEQLEIGPRIGTEEEAVEVAVWMGHSLEDGVKKEAMYGKPDQIQKLVDGAVHIFEKMKENGSK